MRMTRQKQFLHPADLHLRQIFPKKEALPTAEGRMSRRRQRRLTNGRGKKLLVCLWSAVEHSRRTSTCTVNCM
jgi:hypothetical protein